MFFVKKSADKKDKHNKTGNKTIKRYLAVALCTLMIAGSVSTGFIPVTETFASEVQQPQTTDETIEDTLYDSLDNSVGETSTTASEVLEDGNEVGETDDNTVSGILGQETESGEDAQLLEDDQPTDNEEEEFSEEGNTDTQDTLNDTNEQDAEPAQTVQEEENPNEDISDEERESSIPDETTESDNNLVVEPDNSNDTVTGDEETDYDADENTVTDPDSQIENTDAFSNVSNVDPESEEAGSEIEATEENSLDASANSGYCGDDVTWELDESGTILISGEGPMYNYASKASPFYMMDQVTSIRVEEGVSSIGEYAFNGCGNLTSINIPISVNSIGVGAFTDCSMLTDFYYGGTQEEWNAIEGGDIYLTLEANLYVIDNPSPVAVPIENCKISEFTQKEYNGQEQLQDIVITYGNTELIEGNDYRIEYANNINAGTAAVTITGTGAYTGVIEKTFDITAKKITPSVKLSATSFVFNNNTQKPVVTVSDDNTVLSEKDYSLSFDSGLKDVGTYNINVVLKGNYSGSASVTYKITAKNVTPQVTLSKTSFVFNGNVQKPSITVMDGSTKIDSANYDVTFGTGLKNTGTYNISVKLKGNYSGSREVSYKITPKNITPEVRLSASSYVYDGKVKKPSVTVYNGNTKMATSEYTVSYSEGLKNAGTYSASVKLKGNYSGAKTASFRITPKKVTPSVTLSKTTFVYNGKAQKPGITVKIGGTKLAASNYQLTWSKGLTNVGTYKIICKLKGNYTGTKTVSYKINPQATAIRSAIGSAKKMTVKWGKKVKQTTGYQIQYSASSKFASGNKSITIAGVNNVSRTINKPTVGKSYYVRVRTYKKVGSQIYYSSWSPVANTATKQIIKATSRAELYGPGWYSNEDTYTSYTFTITNRMMVVIPIRLFLESNTTKGGVRVTLENSAGRVIQNGYIDLKGCVYEEEIHEDNVFDNALFVSPGTYTCTIKNTSDGVVNLYYSIRSYLKTAEMATIKKNISVSSGESVILGKLRDGYPLFKSINYSNKTVVLGYKLESDGTIWLYGNKKGNTKATMTLYNGKKYTFNIYVTAGRPSFFAYLYDYNVQGNYFVVKIKNLRPSPVTVIRKGAKVENSDNKAYDRNIKSTDSVRVKSGETKYVRFYVNGNTTSRNVNSFYLSAKFEYEGVVYDWGIWDDDSRYMMDDDTESYYTYWEEDWEDFNDWY